MSFERDERIRELLQQALSLLGEHEDVKELEAAPAPEAAPTPEAAPAPTETPTEAEAEAMAPVPGPEAPEASHAEVTA